MTDSIIFLGTGGDEFTVSKQMIGSGGIIVKAEGYQFHIDPGPGALTRAAMYDVNLRENTAVLVSHAHLNHCNDVNAVLSAMSHNGLDVKGVLIANNTFINGDEKTKPYLTDFHNKCVERVIVANSAQKIGIENVEIHILKAKHTDPKTVGFKFITPKFTLSYSSDTRYVAELVEEYKDSDILILNIVEPFDKKQEFNLSADDAVNIISRVKPKLAIITHFGKNMIEADPMYIAREIQKRTSVQVIAAKDGLSISPVSYAPSVRQKKLDNFEGHGVDVEE
ncbi:MAG: MBL fold metallo-hydrolase [Nanoarchaeota archaeon]|nr:MBL fold metallo-hydrolase [Nanoarchaeota archaeon]